MGKKQKNLYWKLLGYISAIMDSVPIKHITVKSAIVWVITFAALQMGLPYETVLEQVLQWSEVAFAAGIVRWRLKDILAKN